MGLASNAMSVNGGQASVLLAVPDFKICSPKPLIPEGKIIIGKLRSFAKYEKCGDFIGKLHWESGKMTSYVFRDS